MSSLIAKSGNNRLNHKWLTETDFINKSHAKIALFSCFFTYISLLPHVNATPSGSQAVRMRIIYHATEQSIEKWALLELSNENVASS